MKELRKNPRALMAVGGLVFLVFVLFIIASSGPSINKGNSETERTEALVIEPQTTVTEITNIADENDIKLQDILVDYIDSGVSGLYTVGDRHFVVLTTGDTTYGNIVYTHDVSTDGTERIIWDIETDSDVLDEPRVLYKILEVDNPNILVEKKTTLDISNLNGYCQLVVFDAGTGNRVYSVAHNKLLDVETLELPGVYMGEFTDGNLESMTKLGSVTVPNSVISDRVDQTTRVYKVKLGGSKVAIDVYMDNINIPIGTIENLTLEYDSALGTFKGILTGGIA